MEALKKIVFSSGILFLLLTGCKEKLVGSDPVNSYQENFEQLWNSYDEHYSYFEIKNVDWDSLYFTYSEVVDTISSDKQLFLTLSQLIGNLYDFHVTLRSEFDFYSPEPAQGTLDKFLLDIKYLKNISKPSPDSPYLFADVSTDIGYLRIETFQGNEYPFRDIDSILETLFTKKGLILDLRGNGGGSDINSKIVMSRFADKKTLIRKIKYRNGPNHDDFSKPIFDFIERKGFYYSKPVVLITDNSIYSAAEDFVLGMRQLPNVITLGESTSGSSGNPITFDLPNGWLFTVPRWQILQPENDQLYENIGLKPDTLVLESPQDEILLLDSKMDAAIRLLLQQE